MAVPILRRILAIIEDNHQGFKGALVFGLLLTSVKVFLCGGLRGCEHMRACASVMWVLKIIFYMWYPQKYISACKLYCRNLYSV